MSRKNTCLILLLAIIMIAFTWPWEVKPPEEKKSAETQEKGIPSVPKERGGIPTKQGEKDTVEAPTLPETVPVIPKVYPPPAMFPQKISRIHPSSSVRVPPIVKPVHPSPFNPIAAPKETTSILNVQSQIGEIIKYNEALKQKQPTQVREIQRIIEQAKIHQRILEGLKTSRAGRKEIQPTNAAEMLRQEKVRLIGQETEKNKQMLQALEERAGAIETNVPQKPEKPKEFQQTQKSAKLEGVEETKKVE